MMGHSKPALIVCHLLELLQEQKRLPPPTGCPMEVSRGPSPEFNVALLASGCGGVWRNSGGPSPHGNALANLLLWPSDVRARYLDPWCHLKVR